RQSRLHLREQDGNRRHQEVEGGGLHPRVARPDPDGRGHPPAGGRALASARHPAVTSPAREGQTFAGESLLVRYVNFVKLPHTLFALPFALLGVLAASRLERVTLRTVLLVVLAFSAARWAAMGFNRVADLRYDA